MEFDIKKPVVIGGLVVTAMAALAQLSSLTATRHFAQSDVDEEVEASAGGRYAMTTPVIALMVRETWFDATAARDVTSMHTVIALPRAVDVHASAAVETRYRGIFRSRLAQTTQHAVATFALPTDWARPTMGGGRVELVRADVVIGMASPNALVQLAGEVRAAGAVGAVGAVDGASAALSFAEFAWEGEAVPLLDHAVGAPLPPQIVATLQTAAMDEETWSSASGPPRELTIDVTAAAMGGGRISILPLAREADVRLTANWPHVSFTSRLPVARSIDDANVQATWRFVSPLIHASPAGHVMPAAAIAALMEGTSIDVAWIQPVDFYAVTDRAVNYGWLIVVLTVGMVWLFEYTRGMVLHPAQYGLVAAGLVLFFLLLLAFGEHVGFARAYAVATIAICTLCTGYLWALFRRPALGLSFAGYFLGVYAALYVMLRAETTALLLGSCVLLAALGVAMWFTRGLHRRALAPAPSPRSAVSDVAS